MATQPIIWSCFCPLGLYLRFKIFLFVLFLRQTSIVQASLEFLKTDKLPVSENKVEVTELDTLSASSLHMHVYVHPHGHKLPHRHTHTYRHTTHPWTHTHTHP